MGHPCTSNLAGMSRIVSTFIERSKIAKNSHGGPTRGPNSERQLPARRGWHACNGTHHQGDPRDHGGPTRGLTGPTRNPPGDPRDPRGTHGGPTRGLTGPTRDPRGTHEGPTRGLTGPT